VWLHRAARHERCGALQEAMLDQKTKQLAQLQTTVYVPRDALF
jgi:hypothetical protein